MLTYTSHRKLDENMYYNKYSSRYYDVIITIMDNKVESVTVSNKDDINLLPHINVFLSDDRHTVTDMVISYTNIDISTSQRESFEKYYDFAKTFVDKELKSFIQKELNTHKGVSN